MREVSIEIAPMLKAIARFREEVRREQRLEGARELDAQMCRAARAVLGLTIKELSALAEVSTTSIWRIENQADGRVVEPRSRKALRYRLETLGVRFTAKGVEWR